MDPALLAFMLKNVTGKEPSGEDGAALQALASLVEKLMKDDDDDGARATLLRLQRERRRRIAERRVAAFQRTMQQFSRRNAFVAGALGACECWGMDVSCPHCGGAGGPGAYEPEVAAFDALVTPLLAQRTHLVRDHLARVRGDEPGPDIAVH